MYTREPACWWAELHGSFSIESHDYVSQRVHSLCTDRPGQANTACTLPARHQLVRLGMLGRDHSWPISDTRKVVFSVKTDRKLI